MHNKTVFNRLCFLISTVQRPYWALWAKVARLHIVQLRHGASLLLLHPQRPGLRPGWPGQAQPGLWCSVHVDPDSSPTFSSVLLANSGGGRNLYSQTITLVKLETCVAQAVISGWRGIYSQCFNQNMFRACEMLFGLNCIFYEIYSKW